MPATATARATCIEPDSDVRAMAQLHADVVMLLIGLSIGLLALLYAVHAPARGADSRLVAGRRELAQGAIGYAQYFLKVPAVLVGVHMLGACLVWVAALRTALMARASENLADRVNDHPDESTHAAPSIRMNCRSRPTCSSSRRPVSAASQRATVPEMRLGDVVGVVGRARG